MQGTKYYNVPKAEYERRFGQRSSIQQNSPNAIGYGQGKEFLPPLANPMSARA